jgi:hypothetical protein
LASFARKLALVGLVVVLAGCQLRVHIGITVKDDGSGTVAVGVGLDEDALKRAGALELDDLLATGWTVTGPTVEADGLHWVRATKPFANPHEAGEVAAEIAAKGGPFKDFAVVRDQGFATTRYRFTGTVDFTAGLETFGDKDLAGQLDGEPLGESIAAIEKRLGDSIDRLVQVEVAVRLPGAVTSNAPLQADNGAKWKPGIGDGAVHLEAQGDRRNIAVLIWSAIAVAAGIGLLVLLIVRVVRWRRRRRRQARAATA